MTARGSRRPGGTTRSRGVATSRLASVVSQLEAVERDGGDGQITLPGDVPLTVSNLDKRYFPDDGITKGDVMRFYVRIAPALLPAIADRPLVLRRYPGGIDGPSFHQHDPGDNTPDGVRVERVGGEPGSAPERRLVGADPSADLGGALATLLYSVQLGAIPVNAWHSRVGSIERPDYMVLDLDPDPKAGFARVIAIARAVHAALLERGLDSVAKTSGSRGIHILVPLDRKATYDSSAALAEEVASEVAEQNPALATVARSLDARPARTVYVDHMQNAAGKTLVAVFSVRAREGALVSTPIAWRQVTLALDPARYTVASVARGRARLIERWAGFPRVAGDSGK